MYNLIATILRHCCASEERKLHLRMPCNCGCQDSDPAPIPSSRSREHPAGEKSHGVWCKYKYRVRCACNDHWQDRCLVTDSVNPPEEPHFRNAEYRECPGAAGWEARMGLSFTSNEDLPSDNSRVRFSSRHLIQFYDDEVTPRVVRKGTNTQYPMAPTVTLSPQSSTHFARTPSYCYGLC